MGKRSFAGIDIGATNIKFGLVDEAGKILFKSHIATPKPDPAEKLFEKVVYCGEQILIEADNLDCLVSYMGVGSPGTVNIKSGVIEGTCPNLSGWIGFHLRERLSQQLNLPVYIDNDANCAAMGEHRFGAGIGYNDILCLTIGTGIGGGIIQDGKIFRGSNFAAGEIGHIMVLTNNDGEVSSEMLESLVSSRAIISALKESLIEEMTPIFQRLIGNDVNRLTIRKLFSAIRKGDKTAYEVMKKSAETLGIALTSVVNVINPELIIIGGGIAEGGSQFVDIVKNTVCSKCVPLAAEVLTVSAAKLGNDAGFIGAAFLGEEENQ